MKTYIFTLVALLFICPSAHANEMSFEGLPQGTTLTLPYTEDGLTMSVLIPSLLGQPSVINNGGHTAIHFDGGSYSFNMAGQLFDLVAIDFDLIHLPPVPVTITANTGASASIGPSPDSPPFDVTFTFPQSFQSITSFILTPDDQVSCVEIDWIQFSSTSVPEPTTMLLLGSGLIGLWGLRKKFRK